MHDEPAFQGVVRSRLMKRGGVGYVQPGHDTFPPVAKLHELILACDALPCAAWLDGTTSGEQRMDELLALLVDKGAVVLNIVPDRNWDIADPDVRALKVQKLYDVVDLARDFDLPLNIGTEMNSYGQKLIDDFDAEALEPSAPGLHRRRLFCLRAYGDATPSGHGLPERMGQADAAGTRRAQRILHKGRARLAPGRSERSESRHGDAGR